MPVWCGQDKLGYVKKPSVMKWGMLRESKVLYRTGFSTLRYAMATTRRDIRQGMGVNSQPPGAAGEQAAGDGDPGSGGGTLAPGEFSVRLEPLRRTLWLIAAAILGGRDDADDVVQEAAVIGLSKLSDFEPSSSFAAWMGQIVRNVARNHARKNHRRQTTPADPAEIDRSNSDGRAGQGSADPLTRDVEFDKHVLSALQDLDEAARMCVLLRIVRGMPYREISHILGIPEGTAMSHVHRARKTLRARLDPIVGFHERGAK